jgi:hypothetical protein
MLYEMRYVGHYPFIIIFALLLLSISFRIFIFIYLCDGIMQRNLGV